MTKANPAPAQAATPEDELPKTAVKERPKDRAIRELQDQLAQYADKDDPVEPPKDEPIANQEEETWKKRYADLRRHTQKLENDKHKEIENLKNQAEQLKAAVNQPMPKTKEEFQAWKDRYPDIATFIELIAEEKASQRASQLQEQLQEVTSKLSETEKEKDFATLKSLVPDVETTVKTKEYKDWFLNQPIFVQDKLNSSEDPYEIAYYMNIYKMSFGKPTENAKVDSRDVLATSVRGTGSAPGAKQSNYLFTSSQIEKESRRDPSWYEKNEAAIIEARNNNQILDDTSKSNYLNMI